MYLLTFLAVILQLILPELLVEMFSTSVGLLLILRNTIHMMHDLKKRVVVEGVEKEEAPARSAVPLVSPFRLTACSLLLSGAELGNNKDSKK